jgi:hypothetical protein
VVGGRRDRRNLASEFDHGSLKGRDHLAHRRRRARPHSRQALVQMRRHRVPSSSREKNRATCDTPAILSIAETTAPNSSFRRLDTYLRRRYVSRACLTAAVGQRNVDPRGGHLEHADRGEVLKRLGTSRESPTRLARKASEAEDAIGIHGVSVTAGEEIRPHSRAIRRAVEASFSVHDTPTRSDRLHRTVELPKPVTHEIADQFNRIFGRQ